MFDISWHEYIDVYLIKILIEGRAEIEGTFMIDGGGVFWIQCVVEVVEIGAGSGADTEIVKHESEGGVSCVVAEEAEVTFLVVTVWPKMMD